MLALLMKYGAELKKDFHSSLKDRDVLKTDLEFMKKTLDSSLKERDVLKTDLEFMKKTFISSLKERADLDAEKVQKREFVWRAPVKSGQGNSFESVEFMINGIGYHLQMDYDPRGDKAWNHGIWLFRHTRASKDVVIQSRFSVLDKGGDAVESTRNTDEKVLIDINEGEGWGEGEFVDLSPSFVDDLLDSDGNLCIAVSVNVLKDHQPSELQCKT